MTIQTPTRITIEIHPAEPAADGGAWNGATPLVHVLSEPLVSTPSRVVVAEPRETLPAPVSYEAADCTCLDGDCRADHGND